MNTSLSFQQLWEALFGYYTPVLTDVYDSSGNYIGQVVASGMAGVDWSYVLSVAAFLIVLYAACRIIEAVIRLV